MKSAHLRAALLRAAQLALAALLAAPATGIRADSRLLRDDDHHLATAEAALRGTVLATRAHRDPTTGRIWTDVWLRTDETFKGRLPSIVRLRQRGGTVSDGGEYTSQSPAFVPGEQRLVRLGCRSDGSVYALGAATGAPVLGGRPGTSTTGAEAQLRHWRRLHRPPVFAGRDLRGTAADGTASLPASTAPTAAVAAAAPTSSGLIVDVFGIPARNPEVDHGAPIPYLVDCDRLPVGITQAQALAAVENAAAAWAAVAHVRFRFEGIASFGQGADDVVAFDGRLRIQLHDTYGSITGGIDVLGIGGNAWTTSSVLGNAGGEGGRVGPQEFHRVVRSFVVLSHTAASLQNPKTLEEVLCHEIGHTLSLAHSSENSGETDSTKRDAMMFAYVHGDNRGATLGTYDGPAARLAYPTASIPPWTTERVLRAVTNPGILSFAGANTLQLRAFDLDTPDSQLLWSNDYTYSNAGTFDLLDASLQFTPDAYYGDASLDPALGSFYARTYVRVSDGVNASPWQLIRVIAFAPDNYPTGGDGLPDAWMNAHFGTAIPGTGNGRRPADDPDNDGFTNLQEFQMGTDPLDAESRLQITDFGLDRLAWNARPYEFYYLESSPDLKTWTPLPATAIQPTTDTAETTDFATPARPREFYRVRFAP